MSSKPDSGIVARVMRLYERVRRFIGHEIWRTDVLLPVVPFYRFARVVYLALHGFHRSKGTDQAAGLAFITVLSLVPLLAFGLSVAKGFGAYDHLLSTTIHPFLDYAFGSIQRPMVLTPPDEVVEASSGDETADGEEEGDGDGGDEAAEATGDAAESEGQPELPEAPEIDPAVAPFEDGALEIRYYLEDLLGVINETDFASLGIFGLVVLLVTVIRLLMNIESAMNEIWGIRRGRRLVRRVSDYVAMVVIAPILTITATAATGAGAERVIGFLGLDLDVEPVFKLVVILLIWVVFALLYLIMPNTRVPVVSALIGGLVGGTAFHSVQLLFVWFQREVANYSAIYAGFAAVPVFLVWVLICWVTVLLGAHVAWAHQMEPELKLTMGRGPLTHSSREAMAVRLVARVSRAFHRGDRLESRDALATHLAVPDQVVKDVLAPLLAKNILARTDGDHGETYVPARDLDRITVLDVIDALGGPSSSDAEPKDGDRVGMALAELRRSRRESSGNLTLRELVEEEPA